MTTSHHSASHSVLRIAGLTVVGAAIIGGLWWWQIRLVVSEPVAAPVGQSQSAQGKTRAQEQKLIEHLKALVQHGVWPLRQVPLSAQRGNPFVPKQ